jgi:electron transport complex protein RnfD
MISKAPVLLQKPQVNLVRSTATRMWLVSACAGITVLLSSVTDSYQSLIIALSAVAAAVATEMLLSSKTRGFTLGDGSAVASALILTLLLPNQTPPLLAAAGAAFAMGVVKYSFGGLGANWVNPALGGWFFIRLSWPGIFDQALEGSPLVILGETLRGGFSDPLGSPLGILKIRGLTGSTLGGAITFFLNKTIFSLTRVELSEGYLDLLVLTGRGIIADRGGLAVLLGSIMLIASQVTRPWVPGVFLGVYALLVRIFGALPFGGGLGEGDLIFGLFSGGTLAAAFLLTSDPVTGPKSNLGTLIFAILAGGFTWLFRYRGNEPYGAFFALFLLNALTPLFRCLETRIFYLKRRGP